jgi:hypothetical protein
LVDKYEYGWIVFTSDKHSKRWQAVMTEAGTEVARVVGGDLATMNRLGAEGWLIDPPIAILYPLSVLGDEFFPPPTRTDKNVAASQHSMRRRIP